MTIDGDRAPVTPSVLRRLASMAYEAVLLFAIAFFATWLFYFANGARDATGVTRLLLQIYLVAVFAAYFMWCWLRGGQTLAMRAWRIRLVAPGRPRVPAHAALVRLFYVGLLLGAFWLSIAAALAHRDAWLSLATLAVSGIGIGWAGFDRDGQFLHDRLAGTRLVLER